MPSFLNNMTVYPKNEFKNYLISIGFPDLAMSLSEVFYHNVIIRDYKYNRIGDDKIDISKSGYLSYERDKKISDILNEI